MLLQPFYGLQVKKCRGQYSPIPAFQRFFFIYHHNVQMQKAHGLVLLDLQFHKSNDVFL